MAKPGRQVAAHAGAHALAAAMGNHLRHKLRPDNEDALFMLTQAWMGYGYGFPQEDYQDAIDRNDEDGADYLLTQTSTSYRSLVISPLIDRVLLLVYGNTR